MFDNSRYLRLSVNESSDIPVHSLSSISRNCHCNEVDLLVNATINHYFLLCNSAASLVLKFQIVS